MKKNRVIPKLDTDSKLYRYRQKSTHELLLYSILRTGLLKMQKGYRLERDGYNSYCISVTVKGRGQFTQGGATYDVTEGDVLFFNQNSLHVLQNDNEAPWEHYYLYFWGQQAGEFCKMFTERFGAVARGLRVDELVDGIQKIHALVSAPIVDEAEISTLIYQILIYLYRAASHDRATQQTEPALLAESYLVEHYKRDLTLDHLASYVNVSKYHLARLYKKTWGVSPMQRLLNLRFERCMEQLSATDLSVSAILAENHFVNYHLFIRLCKERTGLTPSQYRKSKATLPEQ